MNEQVQKMQTQSLEQMKAMQTQVLEMNERIAESVMGVMPEMPAPFAENMPKPADMMSSYFNFMGEVRDANVAFVQSMMSAWMPADAPAKPGTKAKK